MSKGKGETGHTLDARYSLDMSFKPPHRSLGI